MPDFMIVDPKEGCRKIDLSGEPVSLRINKKMIDAIERYMTDTECPFPSFGDDGLTADRELGTFFYQGSVIGEHLDPPYPPPSTKLMYLPTNGFLPHTFIDPKYRDEAIEMTNTIHLIAYNRFVRLTGMMKRPKNILPQLKMRSRTKYHLETTWAIVFRQLKYYKHHYGNGLPALTEQQITVEYPAGWWAQPPMVWMLAGGLVGSLMKGLFFTSHEEREIIFSTYPVFWDVYKCVWCGFSWNAGYRCDKCKGTSNPHREPYRVRSMLDV